MYYKFMLYFYLLTLVSPSTPSVHAYLYIYKRDGGAEQEQSCSKIKKITASARSRIVTTWRNDHLLSARFCVCSEISLSQILCRFYKSPSDETVN